jgi:hypothetical protein
VQVRPSFAARRAGQRGLTHQRGLAHRTTWFDTPGNVVRHTGALAKALKYKWEMQLFAAVTFILTFITFQTSNKPVDNPANARSPTWFDTPLEKARRASRKEPDRAERKRCACLGSPLPQRPAALVRRFHGLRWSALAIRMPAGYPLGATTGPGVRAASRLAAMQQPDYHLARHANPATETPVCASR